MDLIGILTRTFLGVVPPAAPAAPAAPTMIVATPLVRAPVAAAATTSLSAPAVVDRVQQFYASIEQVTAKFRQTVTYETFGSTKTSDGKLWLQKPGKMRWDYYDKKKSKVTVKKNFISNGSYLYMVEHDNKQVVKKNLQQDLMPVAVSFLYGKGDLKAEFNAELDKTGKYGGKTDLVLKLTPKKPSAQYKNLFLVVDPKDFHVTQSVIVDSSGNVNHFRFYEPDFKTPIKQSSFEFNPASVKHYRLIDADQQQQERGAGPAGAPAPTLPAPPAR